MTKLHCFFFFFLTDGGVPISLGAPRLIQWVPATSNLHRYQVTLPPKLRQIGRNRLEFFAYVGLDSCSDAVRTSSDFHFPIAKLVECN